VWRTTGRPGPKACRCAKIVPTGDLAISNKVPWVRPGAPPPPHAAKGAEPPAARITLRGTSGANVITLGNGLEARYFHAPSTYPLDSRTSRRSGPGDPVARRASRVVREDTPRHHRGLRASPSLSEAASRRFRDHQRESTAGSGVRGKDYKTSAPLVVRPHERERQPGRVP